MYIKKIAAISAAAIIGFSGSVSAAVLATFDITGDYDVASTVLGGTTFDVEGAFRAEVLAPFPDGVADYTLSAGFTLNGNPITSGDLPVSGDVDTILPEVFALRTLILANANTTIPLPGGLLEYGGTFDTMNPPGIESGTYFINLDTFFPLGAEIDDLLALLDPGNLVIPAGFSFPTDDSGNFEINLAISTDMTPVPLPASLPLLAVGGLALFGISRRRKKT